VKLTILVLGLDRIRFKLSKANFVNEFGVDYVLEFRHSCAFETQFADRLVNWTRRKWVVSEIGAYSVGHIKKSIVINN